MNAKPVDRLHGLDLERFKRTIESPEFALVFERVKTERDRVLARCATADDELDVRRAQGAAAALKTVLDLPRQVYAELRSKKPS